MTDKDIIKALECCAYEQKCGSCPLMSYDHDCSTDTAVYALDLINRQQAEIERLKNRQKPTGASGYKIEKGKVVFFTNMLDGYRHEYKDLEEVVKTLNEQLQECYNKDEIAFALKCKTEDLKKIKSEAIKEFAERLRNTINKNHYLLASCHNSKDFGMFTVGIEQAIDEVAKEMESVEE